VRAAILRDGATELTIEEIEHGVLGAREVLVRTRAVGLCHSDVHYLDGTLQRPRPTLIGHEAAGIVEAVGDQVTSVAVGDHVVTCLVQGCGSCARCEHGEPTSCEDPAATKRAAGDAPRLRTVDGLPLTVMGNVGALSEKILLDERGLVVIPAAMPSHLAAILGCAMVTGLGAVFNVAEVRPGDTVAVIGCGGVGLAAVQGARIAGASRIIAIDLSEQRLDAARTFGATDVVHASEHDPVEQVLALTRHGVDHAFEVVGRPATVAQALAITAPGRNAYVVGVMADDAMLSVPAAWARRGRSLVGVFMGDARPRLDIARYVAMWQQGQLDLEAMVTRTLPLDDVNDGFRAMVAGEVNRAVVTFS
jgi:S-(hydroxymethyl)glutathione dehydrogenase / alcohol dehydrogenase